MLRRSLCTIPIFLTAVSFETAETKKVDLRLCRLEHEEVLEKMEIELLRSD